MSKLINIVFIDHFSSEILIVKCIENVIWNVFKPLPYSVYEKCYMNLKKPTQINIEVTFLEILLNYFIKWFQNVAGQLIKQFNNIKKNH